MYFSISRIGQGAHNADKLQNPKNSSNPMVLNVYRIYFRTALFSRYNKKAFGEFWDTGENKKIANRLWTPEMKSFAHQKIAETPKPPFIFKFSILGWIFMLLALFAIGYIIYEETKPPLPKSAESIAMAQKPLVGDIYFGYYEQLKEKGSPIRVSTGFGWFKINKIEGDDYFLSPSTQMSKDYLPKEQMNNTDFETENFPKVKLVELKSYTIRFESTDGLMEISISDKK